MSVATGDVREILELDDGDASKFVTKDELFNQDKKVCRLAVVPYPK